MRKRRALFIAYRYPPLANVGVFRTLRFTRYLGEFGWHSSVVTLTPDAGAGRVDQELSKLVPPDVSVEHVDLVRLEERIKPFLMRWMPWLPGLNRSEKPAERENEHKNKPNNAAASFEFGGEHTFREKVLELLFALPDDKVGWKGPAVRSGIQAARKWKPDVVIGTAPPFTPILVAQEIAQRLSLPLVIDFRDPWSRVPWGPRNKSFLSQWLVRRMEKQAVRSASKVILNTRHMADEFREYYSSIPAEKFVYLSNGFDPDLKREVDKYLKSYVPGQNAVFRLMHPGSLYRNRDPRSVLHALSILKDRGVAVRIEQLGPVESSFELDRIARELNIDDRFSVEPAVPHQEMLRKMVDVDGFLLIQPETAIQVPGKLFEMILFRKPIAAVTCKGAVADIVEKYKIGEVSTATCPNSIADSIQRLVEAKNHTGNWSGAIADFDGCKLTRQLAENINSVC